MVEEYMEADPLPVGEIEGAPRWRAWLDRPLSQWWCVLGWLVSTALFVGLIQLLGGPSTGDSFQSTDSTWAIAHGQAACAFPSGQVLIAPVYPLLAGGVAAVAHIGHSVPFPPPSSMGPHCDKSFSAINAWANRADPWTATVRIGYGGWVILLAGVVSLLRASGRGRRGWEPATLLAVACLPPVWLCVEDFFHPQDLFAMGFSLAAMACARRDAWVGAGVLIALAVLSQQFALLVAVPLLVLAPAHRRAAYAGSAIVAAAVVTLPLLVLGRGGVARDILLGSGNAAGNGGTVVYNLHLHGAPLFLVSRLLPIGLSLLLAAWAVRRLGRAAALEPVALVSVVALCLGLRLVFERNFYGYYFMAFVVALVLLDVVAGRIRGSLVAWLVMVSLAFVVGPSTSVLVLYREPWALQVQRVLPPAIILLALLVIALRIARGGLGRYLLIWLALVAGALLAWPSSNNPVSDRLPSAYWQVVLVLVGLVLAAQPLVALVRAHPQEEERRRGHEPVPSASR